jgi:hypothetical protein
MGNKSVLIYLTVLDIVLTAILIGLGAGVMGALFALVVMGLLFLLVIA